MRHRATKAAPSADSATAFSKYFSPTKKEKYERKKSGSETSLELAAPMRAKSARLGNLSCPPKAGEPNAGHLFFGQCDHKWYDSNGCKCSLCKEKLKYERELLFNLKINDCIVLKHGGKEIVGTILETHDIQSNTRKVYLRYKTWIHNTILNNKEKWLTLSNEFVITGSLQS